MINVYVYLLIIIIILKKLIDIYIAPAIESVIPISFSFVTKSNLVEQSL